MKSVVNDKVIKLIYYFVTFNLSSFCSLDVKTEKENEGNCLKKVSGYCRNGSELGKVKYYR